MVASSGVLLSAWRGVRHIQIPPIAYVLQGHTVEVDAGAGGLVALADVPLVADVTGRELSLLLLAALAVLSARVGGLGLVGLALQVGPCSNKIVPVGR